MSTEKEQQAQRDLQDKITRVRDQIIKVLVDNELAMIPQLEISHTGIEPVIAFTPQPKKSPIEIPNTGIELPK